MQGKISQWFDDKGFGFILPDDGSEKIFFHVSSVKTNSRRPIVGDTVLFDAERDSQNRLRAKTVVIDGAMISSHSHSHSRNRRDTAAQSHSSVTQRKSNSPNYALLLVCCITVIALSIQFFDLSFSATKSYAPLLDSNSVAEVYASTQSGDVLIRSLYTSRQGNVQVTGSGRVERILSDDNEGSRHQRFILRLSSGQTLLISHNIDIAPRVSSLSVNDRISFNGEYEWNSQGGVIHWTHHDPNDRHVAGFITHQGKTYQ